MIEFGKYSDGTAWIKRTLDEELSRVQADLDQCQKALTQTKKIILDVILKKLIGLTLGLFFFLYIGFYVNWFVGSVMSIILIILVTTVALPLFKDFKKKKMFNISLDRDTRHLLDLETLVPIEAERIKKCRQVLKRYSAVVENTKFITTEELEDMVLSGQTPEDFETQIKSLIDSANKKEVEKYEQVRNKALADFEAKQKQRDQILSALKKRIKEIEQRVKSGDLEEGEGELLKSSAKRDIEVNLQALDQA